MGLTKRGWIWVLAVLVVTGVFAAFRLSKKTDPDYFTAKVEKGDIRQVIEATGTINPVTSVQVGSQGDVTTVGRGKLRLCLRRCFQASIRTTYPNECSQHDQGPSRDTEEPC